MYKAALTLKKSKQELMPQKERQQQSKGHFFSHETSLLNLTAEPVRKSRHFSAHSAPVRQPQTDSRFTLSRQPEWLTEKYINLPYPQSPTIYTYSITHFS